MKSRIVAVALGLLLVSVAAPWISQAAPQDRLHNVPKPVTDGSARLVKHMNPAQMLRLTLTLEPPLQDAAEQFLRDVEDPGSPGFHQFLTFDDWKARYAPSDSNVARVTEWATGHGLTLVHVFRDNLAIKVEADAATIEQAFAVQLNHYETANRKFFSNDRDPALPAELAGVLKSVHGLENYYRMHPASQAFDHTSDDEPIYQPGPFMQVQAGQTSGNGHHAPPLIRDGQGQIPSETGTASPNFFLAPGGGYLYEPPDLFSSQAYDLAGLNRFIQCCNPTDLPGGTPKEASIAIIGAFSLDFKDWQTFAAQYGLQGSLTQHMEPGAGCCDDEMTLDAEWSLAFANSSGNSQHWANIHAYEGGGSSLSNLLDAWHWALSDDNARVASTSFGGSESDFGGLGAPSISAFTDVINSMQQIGWTVTAASGDHGATNDCSTLSVNFPASSPNVIAAGGTYLQINNNGGNAVFKQENPWNGPGCNGQPKGSNNNGGGGGGCASVEPAGSYQQYNTSLCGGTKRSLPDLALNAKFQVVYYGGNWNGANGTSIVAPELAGYFANVNSYLLKLGNVCGSYPFNHSCAPFGPANASLWALGRFGLGIGHNPYYDILPTGSVNTDCIGGDNSLGLAPPYCAAVGYDQATGWGSFNMLQMAWALAGGVANGVPPSLSFTGPAVKTWYKADQVVKFTVVSPTLTGTGAAYGVAGYTAQWDAAVADPSNPGTPGGGNAFYDGPAKLGSDGFLTLAVAGLGCHTVDVRGWDRVGNTTGNNAYGPLCFDPLPPIVITYAPSPSSIWRANDVAVEVTTKDQPDPPNGSGLANPADADFFVSTSVPAGTETASAYTGIHAFCDVAGNCNQAGPYGPFAIDKKPPAIIITSPTNTQYIVNQPVPANYSCVDGGSGVATCSGPVASGSNIAASSVGNKTFTVNATDKVANASSSSVSYSVTFRICPLYDPSLATNGQVRNIILEICDYNSANQSTGGIVLHALAVDGTPALAVSQGNVNPGNNFLFGLTSPPYAAYKYTLNTSALKAGPHVLSFTVQGDPIVHLAPFTLD